MKNNTSSLNIHIRGRDQMEIVYIKIIRIIQYYTLCV